MTKFKFKRKNYADIYIHFKLKNPKRIIVCEMDENRIVFINDHYHDVLTITPDKCLNFVNENSDHGGADVVLEVA